MPRGVPKTNYLGDQKYILLTVLICRLIIFKCIFSIIYFVILSYAQGRTNNIFLGGQTSSVKNSTVFLSTYFVFLKLWEAQVIEGGTVNLATEICFFQLHLNMFLSIMFVFCKQDPTMLTITNKLT